MSLNILDAAMVVVILVCLLVILLVSVAGVVAWAKTEYEYHKILKQNKHEMIIRRMKIVIAKLKIGRTRIY